MYLIYIIIYINDRVSFKDLIKKALGLAVSEMNVDGKVNDLSHLSSSYYGAEPYYDALKEGVTPYPPDCILVAAKFASRTTGLG